LLPDVYARCDQLVHAALVFSISLPGIIAVKP
jgi:hypothetical protein